MHKRGFIVYVGVIEHRHGFNTYVGYTEADLNAKLAAYCDTYGPGDAGDPEAYEEAVTDEEKIEAYFFENEKEFLVVDTDKLFIPGGA